MRVLTWIVLVLSAAGCAADATTQAADPLPSWNEGPTRDAIVEFVESVTTSGSADFVPPEDRIATFDNDGTLWSEQPMYFQLAFAMERVKAMAPDHPEWREDPAFAAVLDEDWAALGEAGIPGLLRIVMATHAGMTADEFGRLAADWLTTARHPRFDRPYTDLVFQPMLELIEYLRANEFEVWIASAGGIAFMRECAETIYGVAPDHVIGSYIDESYELRDGQPVVVRNAEIDFINDGPAKPVGILRFIGKRPIAAFGNSDGDLQMLQWTMAGEGPRFALYVHHTDDEREWAYDRESHIGGLDKGLDEAKANGWTVVDMKEDWRVIYPFER